MKRVLRGINNLLKIIIKAIIICSLLTFTLMVSNSVMRIFIRLEYYVALGVVLSILLACILICRDYKKIFYAENKIRKNKVLVQNKISKDKKRKISESKRKIS